MQWPRQARPPRWLDELDYRAQATTVVIGIDESAPRSKAEG